jgi:hypothetical protein
MERPRVNDLYILQIASQDPCDLLAVTLIVHSVVRPRALHHTCDKDTHTNSFLLTKKDRVPNNECGLIQALGWPTAPLALPTNASKIEMTSGRPALNHRQKGAGL